MQLTQSSRGSLELTAAMILSGSIGYFVIDSGQPAWNVVFFRCLFGAIALGLYCGYRGTFTRHLFQPRLILIILFGGLTLVGNWVLLFYSFEFVAFSIATVAYHTQPLFLVIAGAWLIGERPSAHVYGWLIVAFIGLFLIIEIDVNQITSLFNSTQSNGGEAFIGILLALGAALLYTVTTLVTKQVSKTPPHFVAFIQVLLGIFMLIPFVNLEALPESNRVWVDLLILGGVHTCLMYILLYASFQRLSTSLIAALSFIYPVVALIVDHFAFDTHIRLIQGLGIVLILLAASAVKFNWPIIPGNRRKKLLPAKHNV